MGNQGKHSAVELMIDGKQRVFDIDDPKLPDWVKDEAFSSDGYPYEKETRQGRV